MNRRFGTASVLEFYASTEGEVVLVNLSGAKPGSKGRRLPGSTDVKIARYDAVAARLVEGQDGFAIECGPDEVGMLLARARAASFSAPDPPLRGVFKVGDAWQPTQDLFRRDGDGDFWLVDHAPELIRTAAGPVPSLPILDALGDLDAVDLAVAYGVNVSGGQAVVAAVTLRAGRTLDPEALPDALSALPHEQWPSIVQVVKSIPLTTWYRPVTGPLRKKGLPKASRSAFVREVDVYLPLTAERRKELKA